MLLKHIATTIIFIKIIGKGFLGKILKHKFKEFGHGFSFDPFGVYTYENIKVGHNVNLGYRLVLMATKFKIIIGNNAIFGPYVSIRGGNHRVDLVGRFISDVKEHEKLIENELGVTIEDDVWIGTNSTVLSGVIIGRGSVIGAGSVVTKSMPPYSIPAGTPQKSLKNALQRIKF
jgi:chloramphenicol O-acetyltransferase type B